MLRKILIALFILLVIAQLIPLDRSVPENIDPEQHFYAVMKSPENVKEIMDRACLDCHSYQTKYPWYSYVAPVSFFVYDHILEAREHLNFEEWGTYTEKKADHKLEECSEEVEEGEMPLESYVWIHAEADLSSEERSSLVAYFKSLRK